MFKYFFRNYKISTNFQNDIHKIDHKLHVHMRYILPHEIQKKLCRILEWVGLEDAQFQHRLPQDKVQGRVLESQMASNSKFWQYPCMSQYVIFGQIFLMPSTMYVIISIRIQYFIIITMWLGKEVLDFFQEINIRLIGV